MSISTAEIRKRRKKRARLKKKLKCRFIQEAGGEIPRPVYVDYKNVRLLRSLIDREGRILPRRRTGTSALFQRAVRRAVLRARFMGFLPYVPEE